MRIYLKEPRTVTETTRGGVEQTRSYPKAGFYNAPDAEAQDWIDQGVAFEATDDNKVNAFRRGSNVAELVDLDAGETLEDCFSTPQVSEPEETEEPVVATDDPVEFAEALEDNDDDGEGL